MICESCKFENREGALFCAECGKPLTQEDKPEDKEKTVILDEVVTNSKESVENSDDSEANTTVLTSDMLKPAGQPVAPQGFAAGPAPVKPMAPAGAPIAPGAMNPQAVKPMAPAGQPAPMPAAPAMNPQMAKPQAPAGQPAPMPAAPAMNPQMAKPQAPAGQPAPMPAAPAMNPQVAKPQAPAGQPAPMPQAPAMNPQVAPQTQDAPKEEKPAKMDKKAAKKAAKAEKKANKGKMGTGTKVYIVLSIILMIAMAGALVWGYFYHTDKMETAKTEKETLIADYDAKLSAKETELANLGASQTELQANVTSLETQLADAQIAQAEAQALADSYIAYDPLIDFAESHSADSSTDMMVSDTVVSTTVGSTVEVYVYFPSQEGQLSYTSSDAAKVDCNWGEEWVNGNVLPIEINALEAGDVTIEVTNDQNDVKEVIFVHIK
ncbi:MAG: hypothetical protein IJX85_02650 [Lachnospiraceae bacterium]|nr:hypothetical protein [Lachnospiraceae bacterium]